MAGISQRLVAVAGMGGLSLLLATNGFAQQPGVTDAPAQPVNMLQQPAQEAQVSFSGDQLKIHAENSSLAAILRLVASESGMKITGLGSDERVFGTFGPASPSDVLSDLLNGAAYDLVLLGNSSHGAPRELILTPSRAGAPTQSAALSRPSQSSAEDNSANDQDSQDVMQPDALPPVNPNAPGIRTPQQLFQQLQQMRQAQQQGIPQQEQPQQQP